MKARSGSRTPSREADVLRRLHAQYAVVRALAASASLAEAAPGILRALGENLLWDFAALWRPEGTPPRLHCVETWRRARAGVSGFEAASRGTRFARGRGLPGKVWAGRRPAWVPSLRSSRRLPRAAAAAAAGLRSAVGVPILLQDRVLGVLELFSREIRSRDAGLVEMLGTVGSQIGQFWERARAEEELATLFRLSRDMLCIAGFDGYLIRLNPAWESTLGWTARELTRRPYLEFVHPDDRASTIAEAGKIAGGSGTTLFENRYLCRDGSYRWLSWNATPLPERSLIYCTVRDVTESRRVAGELVEAREAALAASRAKGDFLANMSHEIRTPMNAVIGLGELLLDTALGPEQREYVLALRDSAESLLGLLNDVLDFSKIEAGMLELDPAEFDLRESLGNTLKTLAFRAHQKGLELACRVAPEVPDHVVGDAQRLRQVVLNLVGNAIKFTNQGEVVVQVEPLRTLRRAIDLRFLVVDTGIGIPAAKQAQIFEAFTQADGSTTREFGGTGLGLAIAARLVQLMNGRIRVKSAPGRGSRFSFTVRFELPARGRRAPARPPTRLSRLRVLVVDDNATNRRILGEMLRHWRMRPVAVESGPRALDELERAAAAGRAYPLVLLDGSMPGMDGFQLAAKIQRQPALAGASIMMLSSSARPGDRARSLELGVAAYLTKPIKQSDLMDAITLVLGAAAHGLGPAQRGRPQPGPGRRLRVLVAEDSPVNQRVAVGLLERRGHAATVVDNGREALAALAGSHFDAVLMDVQMPEMDGLEATAAIRERERSTGAHVPILAVTAHAMSGDAERCLAAGMDAYLPKPLQARELTTALERLAGEPGAVGSEDEPTSAPVEAGGPVDAGRLVERVGGDRAALGRLVALFRADAPRLLRRIRTCLERRDASGLREAAHALKGAVSNFAAPAATEAAGRLQEMGARAELTGAREALSELEGEIARVVSALERLVSAGPQAGRRTK